MRRAPALIVCAISILAPAAIAQPQAAERPAIAGVADPRCTPIDNLLASFIAEKHLPGAALAIARRDRLVYARGFGSADLEAGRPVQPDTLFRIASVSKPLTAAAILRLAEQGRLSLDDHAFAVLGGIPADADPRLAKIMIRDLLSHAGGFDRGISGDPMFMSRRIATDLHIPSPPSSSEIIRWMSSRPLDFDPGSKSVYSNFGYCILGRVIEHAGGRPYDQYVQEEILRPVGITRMRLGATLDSGRIEGESRYYTPESGGPSVFDNPGGRTENPYGSWCLESMDAHGGWIASAPDLVRFAIAIAEPGRILSKESIDAMWSRPPYLNAGEKAFYALGWNVRLEGATIDARHNGSLPGTSTMLVRRTDGLAWAVLFNTREGDPAGTIATPLQAAIDAVKDWPEGEPLFTSAPAAPPASRAR
jgi:CubicO group peptidase (beta-lactamase class C family)